MTSLPVFKGSIKGKKIAFENESAFYYTELSIDVDVEFIKKKTSSGEPESAQVKQGQVHLTHETKKEIRLALLTGFVIVNIISYLTRNPELGQAYLAWLRAQGWVTPDVILHENIFKNNRPDT